ncbi:MAG: helix-turn-helix domain-containing protein [Burkholderiales bacterium]
MRTGRPRQSLDLSMEERTQLESIIASRSLPHGLVRRAQMVLWTETGMPNREVARRLKVSAPTVNFWRGRFRARRVAGLHDELKPGRPRSHGDERLARLLKTAIGQRPKTGTQH